ncbi:prolyl-tRNA editing enzyme YbaK/EbsC (Cys-tRNA(Pro) deacylase) [Aequitasia blattaphilus]|uniref:YbaK/EbsC family protein n=1 Tax=Aequitasia blattaphilus TaxID=2949332 RepID=A0ABT1E6C6_9FIRM|nr:YbaK/EbsC family protein [Aequitasia blattaphilus]MCP1101139.1 YbaK/EbsC family protein [Aequitasia blattaphilus]MCR8613779.1 YbaK/EbsC family protein [Aequitasia blattaphilus]
MSIDKVREYFKKFSMENQIIEKEESCETVEKAALAVGCEPGRIAKTLSFDLGEDVILVLFAGDMKVDNKKFKEVFGIKPRMLKAEVVEEKIGHRVGGVCPFGIKEGVDVYLDISLKRYETVFPAAGSGNSMIELSLEELEKYSNASGWVDTGK